MAERKKRAKPGGVVMGARDKVAQFVGERHWTVLSGGELPYPVAVSLAADSDGQPRCTGLVIGMSTSGDADAEVFEITSASARDACRIPDLLQAIIDASAKLADPRTVTAEELAELAGPGYDPSDFETRDGGKTYTLPALMGFSGAGNGRPFLDRLYPGMEPDLPPRAPQIRGQALPREHFEIVAGEYRLARRKNPAAPMRELMRRLSIWKGHQVPEPTARRWVQRARDMGLLGPSHSGKAGEYPPAP